MHATRPVVVIYFKYKFKPVMLMLLLPPLWLSLDVRTVNRRTAGWSVEWLMGGIRADNQCSFCFDSKSFGEEFSLMCDISAHTVSVPLVPSLPTCNFYFFVCLGGLIALLYIRIFNVFSTLSCFVNADDVFVFCFFEARRLATCSWMPLRLRSTTISSG